MPNLMATLWIRQLSRICEFRLPNFAKAAKCRAFGFCFFHFALCFCAHHSTRNPLYFYPPPCAKFAGECTHRFCHSRLGRGRSKMMVCDSAAFGCLPEMSLRSFSSISNRHATVPCAAEENFSALPSQVPWL